MVLADNGHEVRLWSHNEAQVQEINQFHTNKKYLPEIILPDLIVGYASLGDALAGIKTVILAVPTKAIREVLGKMRAVQSTPLIIAHVSKGIEPDTLLRVSELIKEEMPNELLEDVVVLSGPSHAEEVSKRHPTTVTVSSEDMAAAEKIQDLFINLNFRVY